MQKGWDEEAAHSERGPVSLYAPTELIKDFRQTVPLLKPLLNPRDSLQPSPSELRRERRFDEYAAIAPRLFRMQKELSNAQVAVFPLRWENCGLGERIAAERLTRRAARYGVPTWIFLTSDFSNRTGPRGAQLFRTSLHRSRRRANEHALPGWSEDFLVEYLNQKLPLRSKGVHPVVGFRGLSRSKSRTFKGRLTERLIPFLHGIGVEYGNWGSILRREAMRRLADAEGVQCDFEPQRTFVGGAQKPGQGGFAVSAFADARRQFVANLVRCDYALCVRGLGNYSFRLFEALSCGRIPLVVDTDCGLPMDQFVDYPRLCVWVPLEELDRISEIVKADYARMDEEAYRARQLACRQAWERHLSPHGFFETLSRKVT